MGILQPWNIVFFVLFVAYVSIRGHFIKKSKQAETVLDKVDLLERILFVPTAISSMALPVIYLFTPFLFFADYELPNWVRGLGVLMMAIGLWLFWKSHTDLGLCWSPTLEIRKEHKVVKDGLYRRVRHPMYSAIFLVCIGQGLILNNWLAGWAVLVFFGLLYALRVRREEQMMINQFGDEYKNYMTETWRLFPRLF